MSTSMPAPISSFDQHRPGVPVVGRQTSPASVVDAPDSATTTRVAATANGQDVTSTSPSASAAPAPSSPGPSLVSIRPLPSPSLYAPHAISSSPTATGQDGQVHVPSQAVAPHRYQFTSLSASTANDYSPSPSPSPSLDSSTMGHGSGGKSTGEKLKENTGRWSTEEHEVFLKGLDEHGKQWKKIAIMIKTRSVVQVRTHAQKYFQKLLKQEKKGGDHHQPSKISTSTASSTSSSSTSPSTATGSPIKRKQSSSSNNSKGNNHYNGKSTTNTSPAMPSNMSPTKRRKVSLEPKKPQQQSLLAATMQHHHRMSSAPFNHPNSSSSHPGSNNNDGEPVVDPSFMNTLHAADNDGELDDSLLDLLDDSSVDAVEHVIGTDDDDDDLEPNPVDTSPFPVSPSVSSMSLADHSASTTTANTTTTTTTSGGAVVVDSNHRNHNFTSSSTKYEDNNRLDMVSSPNPAQTQTSEDFSIHNKIGTTGTGEVSPTSVACLMDIKDFEQKTSNYVDPLDWLMDVGVYRLPASEEEADDEEHHHQQTSSISVNKLAQVNSSALSVLDNDVF